VLTPSQLLEPLARRRTDQVVITTMALVRPWGLLSGHPLDFASADSAMGHAADLALGIALARPDRCVICLNGDGSMLMSLGTLVTIAGLRPPNLVLAVAENRTYEITGNQPIPGANVVDFAGLAAAAGFPRVHRFTEAADWEDALDHILRSDGPTFVGLAAAPGAEGPITRGAHESAAYLRISLAESARRLRAALGTPA
jgi:thiamine pyrophosphate-dependent acetolactate synthase large subunit-like protein